MDLFKIVMLIILVAGIYIYVSGPGPSEPTNVTQENVSVPLHSEEKPLSPLDFVRRGVTQPRPSPSIPNTS